MNKFFLYLRSLSGGEIADLADICETKPVYLKQVASGHRKAGHLLARAIERATNGAVTVHDLRPDIFGPAPGVAPARPAPAQATPMEQAA